MSIVLSILSTVIIAVGAYYVGFGSPVLSLTASEKEKLWGYTIPLPKKVKTWRLNAGLGWGILVLGCVILFINFMICCWAWEFPWHIWAPQLLLAFIPIFPAWKKGKKWIENTLTEADNALFLGSLPILQAVDAQVPAASEIRIANEGITTFDQMHFPRYTAYFSQYQMGNLENDAQKILLSYYFRQKYKGMFTCVPNATTHYAANGQVQGTTVNDVRFIRK